LRRSGGRSRHFHLSIVPGFKFVCKFVAPCKAYSEVGGRNDSGSEVVIARRYQSKLPCKVARKRPMSSTVHRQLKHVISYYMGYHVS
jgi:hypothetical protein